MRCTIPTLLGLLTLAAPLAAQAKPGHVYEVFYYQALPGKEQAYNKAIAEASFPFFDELVKRKVIVSYLHLAQGTGAREYTHLLILEFANWAALDGIGAKLNEAAQAALHQSLPEFLARFTELRREVRAEFYSASGQ